MLKKGNITHRLFFVYVGREKWLADDGQREKFFHCVFFCHCFVHVVYYLLKINLTCKRCQSFQIPGYVNRYSSRTCHV